MFEFYRITVSALANTQNQLGLSSVHHCIKPSWVHSQRVQILFLPDVSISPRKTFDTCINQISYSNPIRSFRVPRSSSCSPLFIYPLVLLFLLIIIIMAINVWLFWKVDFKQITFIKAFEFSSFVFKFYSFTLCHTSERGNFDWTK